MMYTVKKIDFFCFLLFEADYTDFIVNFTICGYKRESFSFYTHIKTIFYVLSLCFGYFFYIF